VRAATTLAFSSSALEAHVTAQLAPVRRIERSQLRPDWQGYAASFVVQRRIAARKDNALLNTVPSQTRGARGRRPRNFSTTGLFLSQRRREGFRGLRRGSLSRRHRCRPLYSRSRSFRGIRKSPFLQDRSPPRISSAYPSPSRRFRGAECPVA
jgi:hypothetical protein